MVCWPPSTEHVCQLSQCGPDIDEPEAGDRTAHVVAGQQGFERRRPFREIVPLPERRPRDQYQQQACFEQQGDEEEPPEQRSASGLDFGEALDLAGHVSVAPRFRFELHENGERT